MGTVDYVAPEQIRGDEVDGRADVYALGCLLFEALTGTLPFGGSSDVAVVYAHLQEAPPRASERRPELPGAVDAVLTRAMAKDRDARQGTCRELVDGAAPALGVIPSRPTRLWRGLAAVASVVAVALAAVAAVALLRGETAAPAPHAGTLVRIDPGTSAATATVPVPGHPGNVVVTPGGIWIADFLAGVLWRFEPASGGLQRITSDGEPRDLAAVGDEVFVGADGEFLSGAVTRYDAVTGVRKDSVTLLPCAMAAGKASSGQPAVRSRSD